MKQKIWLSVLSLYTSIVICQISTVSTELYHGKGTSGVLKLMGWLRPNNNLTRVTRSEGPTSLAQTQILVDSCQEESDFVYIPQAFNHLYQLRSVHVGNWVFVTKCKNTTLGTTCRGFEGIGRESSCLQKTGWAKAYVKPIVEGFGPLGQYRWEWIAVNRSCNCAIEP